VESSKRSHAQIAARIKRVHRQRPAIMAAPVDWS
jgi:hypothetical protein